MGWGCYLHAKHPNWKTRVITLDLSVKGDPASKYAAAGTVLGVISPLKFHHYQSSVNFGGAELIPTCGNLGRQVSRVQRNILPEDRAQQLLLIFGTHLPQYTVP
jgi:hypothetical protein